MIERYIDEYKILISDNELKRMRCCFNELKDGIFKMAKAIGEIAITFQDVSTMLKIFSSKANETKLCKPPLTYSTKITRHLQ